MVGPASWPVRDLGRVLQHHAARHPAAAHELCQLPAACLHQMLQQALACQGWQPQQQLGGVDGWLMGLWFFLVLLLGHGACPAEVDVR
eukprot:CAMPEP_0202862312 /NCGR_PEP_ID=MMETSP1391-20130828/3396_1 /ASSEMBLY_ACC=CAM_ASM_000867 /TAXON_ID=1034604 /ORGANISM="Chlamydomonas leiostraca, Strain SAG 11-49" /LENGTH=87 /DNA_ID=CAMNT_0049541827 /DNA_START=356 /DNA_END=619 /DNA_ORIENTATION=+